MKRFVKTVAAAVVTALSLTGVTATASAAPAPVSTTYGPQTAMMGLSAEQIRHQFQFSGISEDGNTIFVDKGTVRQGLNNTLELVGTSGSVLFRVPLRGYDAQHQATYPLTATIAADGRAVTFHQPAHPQYTPLTPEQRQVQQELANLPTKTGDGALQEYIRLVKISQKDPVYYNLGAVAGCLTGTAISVFAALALFLGGYFVFLIGWFLFWPAIIVGLIIWASGFFALASGIITCPVGWVIGSAALPLASDNPELKGTAQRFWDKFFAFNWF